MATPTERRLVVRILMESSFYCGALYAMPLRERFQLVKRLEEQMFEVRSGQQANPKLQRLQD